MTLGQSIRLRPGVESELSLREPDLGSLDAKLFERFTKNSYDFKLHLTISYVRTGVLTPDLSTRGTPNGSDKLTRTRGL